MSWGHTNQLNSKGKTMSNNSVKLPIGTTVHRFLYDFVDGSGMFKESKTFTKTSAKVVLNNGKKVVLDDDSYTSLYIVDGMGLEVGEPCINMRVCDSTYGNSFTFLLYTSEDLTVEDISSIIVEGLMKKFNAWGDFYLNNIAEILRSDFEELIG